MLVSLKEVRKYVDLEGITAQEIANRLTFSGIEVEDIKEVASATNLVIGKVISCKNHPDSDHLHVCKVDIGSEILDIVCGAPNCREGLKVIVAKAGAILNHDKEIKCGEIRGQVSNGMLCALNELGVDPKTLKKEQLEGIEELSDDAIVGNSNVLEYLGLDDEILDLKLLANRSDCYSLFNVARELGALFNRKVNLIDADEISTYKENDFKVKIENEKTYSFYTKICKGIEVKESPLWLKNILRSQNINSVNNIVDLGNYIMLLTGQPIHCYDLNKLEDNSLVIKDSLEGEFIALDNNSYKVINGDICVTSNNKIMCLGGIIGANNSKIDFDTKDIVIEVANFDFASIRKSSIRLGISTDSSQRFIKGINKDQSEYVINLFIKLLKSLSKVDGISNFIYEDKLNHDIKELDCSLTYINNRLGSNFSFKEVKDVLTLLNFEVIDIDSNNFKVKVPSFRIDIDSKADLSEEVIRYYGFDSIKNELPVMETTVGKLSSLREKERVIENYLLNQGLYEVLTYTLINKKDNEMFNILNNDDTIEIFNPLTEDHKYIRKNLLSSILRSAEYNINHNNDNVNLFEISNVYSKKKEETHLSFVLVGNKFEQELKGSKEKSFYDAKGLFENILTLFNISDNRIKYERFESNEFHPGRSALVKLDGKLIAVFGEIHPSMKKEFSFNKESVIMGEINLTNLFASKSGKNKFSEISKFPSITRDLAFIISNEYRYLDLKNEIKKVSSLIKKVEIFDIYNGEHVKKGYTSYAIRLTLLSNDETLKEEQISLTINKVKETLINKFKVDFRG